MRHLLKVTVDDDGNDDDNECDVTQWRDDDDDHDEGDTVHQQPSMCHTVTQQRPIRQSDTGCVDISRSDDRWILGS